MIYNIKLCATQYSKHLHTHNHVTVRLYYTRNKIYRTETLRTLRCEVRKWSHMVKILGLTPGRFQY